MNMIIHVLSIYCADNKAALDCLTKDTPTHVLSSRASCGASIMGMSPDSHCWNYYPGTLSRSQVSATHH